MPAPEGLVPADPATPPDEIIPARRCAITAAEGIRHAPHLWAWDPNTPTWHVIPPGDDVPPGALLCDGITTRLPPRLGR